MPAGTYAAHAIPVSLAFDGAAPTVVREDWAEGVGLVRSSADTEPQSVTGLGRRRRLTAPRR